MTEVIRSVAALRAFASGRRRKGERVGLTPTMGALHEGHLSLVRLAQQRCDCVIATIFVNPTQFAAHEDLSRYPRPFEADVDKLRSVNTTALFAPSVDEMYPPGDCTRIKVGGPALAELDDVYRPTHFEGVATVVAKLMLQANPDLAVFGEKDWQQLAVIRQMASDLMINVEVLGAPTLRAADGLALSSRNMYLSIDERAKAPTLHAVLQHAAGGMRTGLPPLHATAQASDTLSAAGFIVDYVTARHAQTLQPIVAISDQPIRLLAAARLGSTRLIDNISV